MTSLDVAVPASAGPFLAARKDGAPASRTCAGTATELRDHGVQLALDHAGEWERGAIEGVIRSIGQVRGEVSAADVHDLLPVLASTNAVGGCFLGLARRGHLVDTGRTVKTRHTSGRCRRVVVWRWVDNPAT